MPVSCLHVDFVLATMLILLKHVETLLIETGHENQSELTSGALRSNWFGIFASFLQLSVKPPLRSFIPLTMLYGTCEVTSSLFVTLISLIKALISS